MFRKIEKKEGKEEKKIFPLDLKVAKVLSVEDHPDADKLYVVQIDLGAEKRQLVAGLKGHYTKEELEGKTIVVITNLKHAKLRGVESQGMLLAGEDKEHVGVLTVDAPPGTSVQVEGYETGTKQLTFEQFQKLKIIVKEGKASYNDVLLKAGSQSVVAEKVKEGKVR